MATFCQGRVVETGVGVGRCKWLKPPGQFFLKWSKPDNTGRLKILVVDWSNIWSVDQLRVFKNFGFIIHTVCAVGFSGSVVVPNGLFPALGLLNANFAPYVNVLLLLLVETKCKFQFAYIQILLQCKFGHVNGN